MKNISKILIIGAGAMGVLPAAKLLLLPGCRTAFLADRERCLRYRRDGIFLNGHRVEAEFVTPEELDFVPELVIVATKGFSLAAAIKLLEGKVAPGTVILPLLNGISAAGTLQSVFPEAVVLHGLYLGHASVREGARISWSGCGKLIFGEPGGFSPAAERVSELFRRAGIAHEASADILPEMWKKFILNIGINQTQALFKADYGTVQRSAELCAYCIALMKEAAQTAAAAGINLDPAAAVNGAMQVVYTMPPEVRTSMLQDVLAGRQTEVDFFAGELCRQAARCGVPVPLNSQLRSLLEERQRKC